MRAEVQHPRPPPTPCFLSNPSLNCTPAPTDEASPHKVQVSSATLRYISTAYFSFSFHRLCAFHLMLGYIHWLRVASKSRKHSKHSAASAQCPRGREKDSNFGDLTLTPYQGDFSIFKELHISRVLRS